ncbi:MAG: DUF547 domain-containing protein [Rhodospirillales bacterium]
MRLLCIAAALFGAVAAMPGRAAALPDVRAWEDLWTAVLLRVVDDRGRIDFAGLAAEPGDLRKVVAFVAAESPASAPHRFPTREATLAYYINAYNALAMHGVMASGSLERFGLIGRIRFFGLRQFTVGGQRMSLYSLENDVIRPLGEARVHFALNCMVVGCPRLPREAFRAAALDKQLEQAAREFVNDARNVRVDAVSQTVWLSAIFDFYTADFLAEAPTLIDYVNRYRSDAVPQGFRARFLDYDWTINRQPSAQAR